MKPTTGFLVRALSLLACVSCMSGQPVKVADVVVRIGAHLDPPRWAVLQRQLLADNVPALREFFKKYFDDRGYLQVFVRWGALTSNPKYHSMPAWSPDGKWIAYVSTRPNGFFNVYPRLTRDDVLAAMRYAADTLAHEEVVFIGTIKM